jgi:uncharacterized membrane protein YhiD involved in acid resistance
MELWSFSSVLALGIAAAVIILVAGVVACFFSWIYLSYRKHVLKTHGTHGQEVQALHERIDRLEKKCATMEEKITDAHLLLNDETRELDKKLSKAFPTDMPPVTEEPPAKARTTRRERTRE